MIDAMTVRGLSARTIECYTEAIARLSRHHGNTNPARLAPEQIEAYLLHLVQDRKLSYSSVNHAASACRFLFETVLGRPTELRHLRPPMAKVARINISQCPACERGRLRVVQTLQGQKRLPDPLAGVAQITGAAVRSRAPPAQGP